MNHRVLTTILFAAICLATILPIVAALDEPTPKYCVDEFEVVQDDERCNEGEGSWGDSTHSHHFRWYYMGGGSNHTTILRPGARVVGGGYLPKPNRTYGSPRSPSPVPRSMLSKSRPNTVRPAPIVRNGGKLGR